MQTAAAGPVDVAEKTVGIEVVGNPLTQFGDDGGVQFDRMPHQPALGVGRLRAGDGGGQHIQRGTHGADVVLTDRARCHGRRQRGDLGF